jgi:hypothetical protein
MKSNPVNKYFSGVKRNFYVLESIYSFIDLANVLCESDFSMKNKLERNRREPACG